MKTQKKNQKLEKKEYLTLAFEVKNIDESASDIFTFEGYASTFGNVDLGYDKVVKGAFTETVRTLIQSKKKLPALWHHDWDEPIGVYTELKEDGIGLFFKCALPREDSFVSGRVIPQIKIGSVSSVSIGYIAREFEYERDNQDNLIRLLKRVDLLEISLVTIPMNPGASITGFKAVVPFQDLPLAGTERAWNSTAAVKRVRSFLNSEDEPSATYKKAFVWFDRENTENFGSYKLPIADVVDGQLVAVPRAIFAAAAALNGARGGVDIPENEMGRAKAHIERYYKKMERESPFGEKSCFRIDFIEQLSDRELERLLRKGVFFSQAQAKKLVKLVKSSQCDVGEGFERDAKSFRSILADIKNL